MDNIAGQKSSLTWAVHISVVVLVVLWLLPTVGLLVSSFRSADQIATTGWWKSLFPQEQNLVIRTERPDAQEFIDGVYVLEGNLFELGDAADGVVSVWGTSSREIDAYSAGETADLGDKGLLTIQANGDYRFENQSEFSGSRGQRVFMTAVSPPSFSLDNYRNVLFSNSSSSSMGKAFINTLTVSIPATIIPILIAAFAAYALAWMDFPGRALLVAFVVGLLVVPLQLALIPLLKLHLGVGIGKGYLGVWLAHTGFGLPLAIYLLRNYMVGLPKDIIENARVDGATEFQIFVKIILPLSFPALASFAIFQFLWTWNDLLVALVFLIDSSGDTTVMTRQIIELLGSKGGNWEILATAAFISITVPLIVFFAMQKYLVRGLLAGSVK
ncbi:maltose ABC transporter membrane protein /trehalose ABC transporter membrane protein /sucrose ABC transporter membrane protein [Pacificibacter maritimus]|uniref:Maltose ABC transporter membrane protein /trehalose ABC transporter membrane protein /sucrose ABC transporter membrane protein n=1 Tax=Pacificibacter maritimus TaxID=762213 RepID=A0A3N4UW06_9RHOB|nr:carbohydrate ABC transporter permease [Pacificibacter maritimus]RPE71711.1 maltose ABC transporter membrane protein /trehalose ABC transporter membrane protein /sucrose ABC transporter membrane protein [Pacificibacter maritimus]